MPQHRAVLGELNSGGTLAAWISDAMRSDHALSVLDAESGAWESRPWRAVHARSEQIAAQLCADAADSEPAALGLVGDPSIDLIAAIQGAWLAGVAVSLLPGPIRGADPVGWAQHTYARFVDIGVGTILGGGAELELLAGVAGRLRVARATDYGANADTGSVVWPTDVDPVAVLQGTAGSTGEPKTALLSASALRSNAAEVVSRIGIRPDRDVAFTWLPLYHDMGLMFLAAGMGSGVPLWVVPNSAFAAAPFNWLHWLTQTRATVTAAPNFAYDIVGRFGKVIKDVDLSAIRFAISGGEPIDPDAFDTFLRVTAKFGFDPKAAAPAYGMAESSCAVTVPDAGEGARYDEVTSTGADGEPMRRRYAMLGRPITGMQVRIVEPDTAPGIDDRRVGQVEIRGTSMMRGYLGQPPLQAHDWFPTGDLGYLVDGRLVICGRIKELVIVAGRNLFPVEIERAAATVSGVRRGGVVAMARHAESARPGLVIVAEYRGAEAESARSDVISEVATACGIRPTEVLLVAPGTVPRTTSGKIRRLATQELLTSGALNQV